MKCRECGKDYENVCPNNCEYEVWLDGQIEVGKNKLAEPTHFNLREHTYKTWRLADETT